MHSKDDAKSSRQKSWKKDLQKQKETKFSLEMTTESLIQENKKYKFDCHDQV